MDKHNLLVVSVILLCYIILIIIVAGKFIYSYQVIKNTNFGKSHTSLNVLENKIKWKSDRYQESAFVDFSYIEEQNVFDEELYLKFLDSYYDNRMLYAAFIAYIILMQYFMLRSIRRSVFEETHFIHMRVLMDYIHRQNDEFVHSHYRKVVCE